MVNDNHVALMPIDELPSDDALPPQGRDGEEDAHENAREFMHRAARAVEGPAQDEGQGREHHEEGAEEDEEDKENQAQHRFGA